MTKKLKTFLLIIFTCSFSYANICTSENPDTTNTDIKSLKLTLKLTTHDYLFFENKSLKVHEGIYLPDCDRDEVEYFRELYRQPRYKALLTDALENSLELRLFIRKCIQDLNLPPELEYLPVVESYYKTTAKSKSGALGLWQFMSNSVYPYLILNDYVDERLDPWKETEAALKKLQENYKTFGDWFLAIGAYNCGAGAMARALAKSPVKDFWYLCENKLLPEQTINYVPKLLAIADLCMNTDYYNTGIPLHEDEFLSLYNETNGLFDYVTVNKPYSLKALAQSMRLDTNILLKLNPSFIEGYTHPTKESTIRLPIGMKQTAEESLSKLEPLEIPAKYVIKKGDTLWGLAKKNNTSVKKICELNNIKENSVLSIGKILYIPAK